MTENYITLTSPEQEAKARKLAVETGLSIKSYSDVCPSLPYYRLCFTEEHLEIQTQTEGGQTSLFTEFVKGALGYRRRRGGGLKQTIAKAIGIKSCQERRTVFDATAGLGADAFVLATLGCQLELIERSPIIAALLKEGLDRASLHPELASVVNERMTLKVGDALEILNSKKKGEAPQVIYLDPMYPEHPKTALNKIELRIVRAIVGDDLDADRLFEKALTVATQRVVVKRPKYAPPLCHHQPSMIVASKKNRYDIYMTGGKIKDEKNDAQ